MGEGAGQVTDMEMDARTGATLEASARDIEDPEVDDLVEDIAETREEMTVTVEQIGDRLDPRNIVEGAKETVREATVGKVEDMANTAGAMVSDAGETVREAGSGIVDTITRNPIPAAMVGLGIGWLALSSRSDGQRQSRDTWRETYGRNPSTRPGYSGATYDAGVGVMDREPSAMDKVGQRVDDVTGQLGRTVDDVTGRVSRVADDVPYQVRSTADHIGAEAGRLFEANPLAVGAIAVGVGAAIGLALPATEMERRAIARPARQVMERAEGAATEALEGVEATAREAEQTARQEEQRTRTKGSRSRSS